jgi:hypothetical protein
MAIDDVAEGQAEVVDESELKHAFSLEIGNHSTGAFLVQQAISGVRMDASMRRTQLEPAIVCKKIQVAVSLTIAFQ